MVDLNMKETAAQLYDSKVSILPLTRKFAADLAKQSCFARSDVLDQGLTHNILQSIHFRPRSTKLVAYSSADKKAIGFIALKKNTAKHYLIEDVSVDPNYRNKGIATKLLNHATTLAKRKGAKIVSLDVEKKNSKAISVYKKSGFREIGRTTLGQRYASGFNRFKAMKRAILGHGFLTKLTMGKDSRLIELNTNSKKNREKLFRVYQKSISKDWIDFFKINADNFINGSGRVWQPPYFRNVLVNNSIHSFALVFHYPFYHKAAIEAYSTSDAFIPALLEEVLKTIANRGIPFTQITTFNPSNAISNWLKEKKMMTFELMTMGKNLN
jgi:ribosomal protein S18 acetylase RimI-like enzyme